MPVLYYRDPADNEWKTLLTKGPAGPPGPQGPQGEPGDDADVTAHEAAADPHAQYATKGYVDGRIWFGTLAAYNAIGTKDPNVLYVVSG